MPRGKDELCGHKKNPPPNDGGLVSIMTSGSEKAQGEAVVSHFQICPLVSHDAI